MMWYWWKTINWLGGKSDQVNDHVEYKTSKWFHDVKRWKTINWLGERSDQVNDWKLHLISVLLRASLSQVIGYFISMNTSMARYMCLWRRCRRSGWQHTYQQTYPLNIDLLTEPVQPLNIFLVLHRFRQSGLPSIFPPSRDPFSYCCTRSNHISQGTWCECNSHLIV